MSGTAGVLLSRMIQVPEEAKRAYDWGFCEDDCVHAADKAAFSTLKLFIESFGGHPGQTVFENKVGGAFVVQDSSRNTMPTDSLCNLVRRDAVKNRARLAALDLVKRLETRSSLDENPIEIVQQFNADISEIVSFGHKSKDVHFNREINGLVQDYKDAQDGKLVAKVKWPWPSLQGETGGIQKDDFLVFYGRPKSMKSWVLCSLIAQCYLSGNVRTLVYTKEMTPRSILRRVTACVIKAPYQGLRLGQLERGGIHERELYALQAEMLEAEVNADGTPKDDRLIVLAGKDVKKGSGDTISWLQGKVEQYQPDVLFIDGLYLMKPSNSKKNMADWQRVMEISRDARQMQLDTQVPIIATMQANRKAAQHQGAELDEIAYSDAIAQDATGIFRVINEKKTPTIALIAGGTREYKLYGVRIHGIPATDFSEKELLTEKDVEKAKEDDATTVEPEEEAPEQRKRGGNKRPNGVKEPSPLSSPLAAQLNAMNHNAVG
jgi:replicative DNA helicase